MFPLNVFPLNVRIGLLYYENAILKYNNPLNNTSNNRQKTIDSEESCKY